MALVRSLRDRSRVRDVAIRTLIVHDDLCLWKEPTHYPTLPNVPQMNVWFDDRVRAKKVPRDGNSEIRAL
jgi:hypothetical protein